MKAAQKEWLTVPEMAERLGIGRVRAYEILKEGEIPTFKLSPRRTRVRLDDVDDYIKKFRQNPSQSPSKRS